MNIPFSFEKMMIERMQEVQRQAEFRTRLGVSRWRGEPIPCSLRRLVGGWLIRAGAHFLRVNPDSEAVMQRMIGKGAGGAACGGGQDGRATNPRTLAAQGTQPAG